MLLLIGHLGPDVGVRGKGPTQAGLGVLVQLVRGHNESDDAAPTLLLSLVYADPVAPPT